ncbi:hypothetical protein L7F22_021396 [Adiantum nelumboides]|nr:hypothetical protein [Adiantum nelumboides]
MPHQYAADVLLKEISQAFTCYADECLRPLLRDSQAEPHKEELAARLLLLQWRSRDTFRDFGEFFCMKLVLDWQSALASDFLDLFAQLDWVLHLLLPKDSNLPQLAVLVCRIATTCRLLYAAHMFLPRKDAVGSSTGEELKRVGQNGRMFSNNQFHCRMRQIGFVNLDQPGKSVVTLKEELGTGGFATVYKGVFELVDCDTARKTKKIIVGDPVAVKMFNIYTSHDSEKDISFGSQLLQSMTEVAHNLSSDKKWMKKVKDYRFMLELSRLVSVRHPNIVTPRGYIGKRTQGESGLVMEVMDESPHDFLQKVAEKKVQQFTDLERLDLMLEIAQGMRFLHECNLMHRDLKPRNVLLRYVNDQDLGPNRFEVKLADFGLTKLYSLAREDKPTHTAPVGTPCYMAPEVRGKGGGGGRRQCSNKRDL